jgi:hypothetical protein
MERSCPKNSMAPVWAIEWMVAGVVLKRRRPDPDGEIGEVSPPGPGQHRKVSMKAKPKEKNKRATNHPTQHDWHEMNRKQRRELTRQMQSADLRLEVVHPDAAGIDIGNESHYVAVPPGRDSQAVRRFGCTTAELKALAARLQQCRIRTVAMQSTGVYWIAV